METKEPEFKIISFDEAIQEIEKALPTGATLRPYMVLVKDSYVSDTRMSSIGEHVEDIFAEDLVVICDNGEKQKVEPFEEKNGDGTFEDTTYDCNYPVLLGIYHYASYFTEEQVLNIVAEAESIPPRYLAVVPLDPTITIIEWHERAELI